MGRKKGTAKSGETKVKTPKRKILFVCTGNTCRSPMAQFLMKDRLRKLRKLSKFDVTSAGLDVHDTEMTSEARQVLTDLNVKLTAFKPTPLTPEAVDKADLVVCMTDRHRKAIVTIMEHTTKKVFSASQFTGEEIMDPFGMGRMAYEDTASQLGRLVDAIIDKELNSMQDNH